MKIDASAPVGESIPQEEAIASLKANRIDPKFLYETPHQAELWRQVFLRHSPIHGNPEFARIYRDAYAVIVDRIKGREVLLVGLGCGTGSKEAQLYSILKERECNVLFCAIDASRDLVVESVQKLTAAGADHERSLVCDLAQSDFLREWLGGFPVHRSRVITFFGLVPNFPPSVVAQIFRSVLRPGDTLLVSAHLAPVFDESREGLSTAMKTVLPQYDNAETRAWLRAGVEEWELENLVEPPQIKIGEMEGIPAFIGSATWKSSGPFVKWGQRFLPDITEPLRLFYSLRYTPALFEEVLRREGFKAQRLAMTSCREEAIWSVTLK